MRPPKARRVVIAVYEGVSLLDLAGPLEAFRVASGFFGSRESRVTYECSVVSIRGGPVKTANGVELGSRLIKSTIQEQRRGRQRPGNCARAYRTGLRCA